eukprot:TRINITY_DN9040_c0_g1_i3.p1 TRINITY_DN9040_c0_g1~~TRINITY_DN9040_c0_g1_i3.p1  ORF type:complete len:1612 (+),score=334.82 TRINITY_DN9040_c0_g1_i3:321-4838(+)
MAEHNGAAGIEPLAALIHAQLMSFKADAAAAKQTEAAGGSTTPAPPSNKSKKGKSATPVDAPGKRPHSMRTRTQEAAHIDHVEDEPSDGPDLYVALSGFNRSELLPELARLGVAVQALVKVVTPDDDEGAEVEDPALGSKGYTVKPPTTEDLQFWDKTRAVCRQAPKDSPLHDIAWKTLDVGLHPEPAATFTRIAEAIYKCLEQYNEFQSYVSSLTLEPVGQTNLQSANTRYYTSLIETVPSSLATPAVILDCMLMHVEQTVKDDVAQAEAAAAAEAAALAAATTASDEESQAAEQPKSAAKKKGKTRPASAVSAISEGQRRETLELVNTGVRDMIAQEFEALLAPKSQLQTTDEGIADENSEPKLLRYNDDIAQRFAFLEQINEYDAEAGARRVMQASTAAQICTSFPEDPMPECERHSYLHKLEHFSPMPRQELDRTMRLLEMEQMLANAAGMDVSSWDLSDYCVSEELNHETFQQVVSAALLSQPTIVQQYRKYFDDILLAVLPPLTTGDVFTNQWRTFTPTPVGFTTYLEHVRGIVQESIEPHQTQGCEIYNTMLSVSGAKRNVAGDDVCLEHRKQALYNGVSHERVLLDTPQARVNLHIHDTAILPDDPVEPNTNPLASLAANFHHVQISVADSTIRRLATHGRCDWEPPTAADTSIMDESLAPPSPRKGRTSSQNGLNRPKSSSRSRKEKSKSIAEEEPVLAETDDKDQAADTEQEFQPVPLHQLFQVQALLSDSVVATFESANVLSLQHKEEPLLQPCQSHLKPSQRQELTRTISTDGHVVRILKNNTREVFRPDGTLLRFDADGQCLQMDFAGTTIQLSATNEIIEERSETVIETRSHPEKELVLQRSDSSIQVEQRAVEFPDGTRLISLVDDKGQTVVRVECLGYPPVVCNGESIVLTTDIVACTYFPEAGRLLLSDSNGAAMQVSANCVIEYTTSRNSLTMNILDYSVVGHDSARADIQLNRKNATYKSNNADSIASALRYKPLLFVVKRDGTATQIHSEASIAEYSSAAERNQDVNVISKRVDADSETNSVTYVWNHREQNPHRQAYNQASILPESLQRKISAYSLWERPASHVAMRQLLWHSPLDDAKRTAASQASSQLDDHLTSKAEEQARLSIEDLRSDSQQQAANEYEQQVMQRLVVLSNAAASAGLADLTKPPEASRPATRSQQELSQRLFRDASVAGDLDEIKAMYFSADIPAFFESDEGRDALAVIQAAAQSTHKNGQEAADKSAQGETRGGSAQPMQALRASHQHEPAFDGIGGPTDHEDTPDNDTSPSLHDQAPRGQARFQDMIPTSIIEPIRPTSDTRDIGQSLRQVSAAQEPTSLETGTGAGPAPLPPIATQPASLRPPIPVVQPEFAMQAYPDEANFGTLKQDCGYCISIKLRNKGSKPLNFQVEGPELDKHVLVLVVPSEIQPGRDAKLEVQVNAVEPAEIDTSITIHCEPAESIVIPVTGIVLSKAAFESKRLSAKHRGKGVRLLSTRPISAASRVNEQA